LAEKGLLTLQCHACEKAPVTEDLQTRIGHI